MTRLRARNIMLLLPAFLLVGSADAQEATTPERARELSAQAATRLKQTKPGVQIDIDGRTGFPKSVRGLGTELRLRPSSVPTHNGVPESFGPPSPHAPAAEMEVPGAPAAQPAQAPAPSAASAAEEFFDEGIGRKLYPRVSASEGVRALRSKADPDFPGSTVVEVQQTYGNLDVLFARAKVNVEPSAAVSGVTASFTPLKPIPVQPAISETTARALARAEYHKLLNQLPDSAEAQMRALEGNRPDETARLVVFDPKLVEAGSPPRLAHRDRQCPSRARRE
jgi:hypothetical protein